MPRKGNVPVREVLPDPMYNDVKVSKLINNIMLDGKKGVAQRSCYDAFDLIKERTGNWKYSYDFNKEIIPAGYVGTVWIDGNTLLFDFGTM